MSDYKLDEKTALEVVENVHGLLAVKKNGEAGAVSVVEVAKEAGKTVGDAVKITGTVLPVLGTANKTAKVFGGTAGKTLTQSVGAPLTIKPNYECILFGDGTTKTWSIQDEVAQLKGADGRDIKPWEAKAYTFSATASSLVTHEGILWENNAATLAIDIPGVSAKWKPEVGGAVANVVVKDGKKATSQESVYNFINGNYELLNNIDLSTYTAVFSQNTTTVVAAYVYPEDTYQDEIKVYVITAGIIDVKFFNRAVSALTLFKSISFNAAVGINTIPINLLIPKGCMPAISWNTSTKLGRVGYKAADTSGNYYTISSESSSLTLPSKALTGGVAYDFMIKENGLPVYAKNITDITSLFVTGGGGLIPDYVTNEGYMTAKFTTGSQYLINVGGLSSEKTATLQFRAKSSVEGTVLIVGFFVTSGSAPQTHRVVIGLKEATYSIQLEGNSTNNIQIGIAASFNTGQEVLFRSIERDYKNTIGDIYDELGVTTETYRFNGGGVIYPPYGSSTANSGYSSTPKVLMDPLDIAQIRLNVNDVMSVSEIFLVLFEPLAGGIRTLLVYEKQNVGQSIDFQFKAPEKGYIIATTAAVSKPYFREPYLKVIRHANIIQKKDLNDNLLTSDFIKKSVMHKNSLGLTYEIDSYLNYPIAATNPQQYSYNRFDHITILPFSGKLISIFQRFGNNGVDYAFAEIVIYSSSDGGVTWIFEKAKPVTMAANAEGNAISIANIDGTVTIFFVKQFNSNAPRPLCRVQLNKDFTFSDEQILYTPSKTNAPGGTPPMEIGFDSFVTWYEGAAVGNLMITKIFKYNRKDKTFSWLETEITSDLATNTGTEEPGIYELPNGDWVCYYRNKTNWCLARRSSDKGLTWGAEFRLFRATWTMSTIKKLRGRTSKLNPIYLAVVNEWIQRDNSDYMGTMRDRRWLILMVSTDGLNFEKIGYVFMNNGLYSAFEPTIAEVNGKIHIGWSTMPPNMGGTSGGQFISQGGMISDTIIETDRILDFINGYSPEIYQ